MRFSGKRVGRLGLVVAGGLVAAGMLLPASAPAAKFGAKLSGVTPVGATPTHTCLPVPGGCTRVGVSYSATTAAGGNIQAPQSGRIKRIRLVAATPGNFRLFLVKLQNLNLTAGTGLAKAKRKGPRISYDGDALTDNPIEHFEVGVKVKRGQFLAIKARKTSTLDCRPTTTHQLVYQPPVGLGGGFVASDARDTCQLLIQAVVK